MDFSTLDPLVRAAVTALGGGAGIAIIGKLIDNWWKRGDKRYDELGVFRREQRVRIKELEDDCDKYRAESADWQDKYLTEKGRHAETKQLLATTTNLLETLRAKLEQAQVKGVDASNPER